MSSVAVETPAMTLSAIRRHLLQMDDCATRLAFELTASDRLLKTTASLCPVCLAYTPAAVFVRGGRVLMAKRCDAHGLSLALLENDDSFYFLSNKDRSGRRFADDRVIEIREYAGGGCCGSSGSGCADAAQSAFLPFTGQLTNKSCTVLVEVTDACNLACPVCYSDAKGDRKMPLQKFREYILRLIEQKGGLDSVQLTGGEALLHPEFLEFVSFLHAQSGVKKIYLPTNGLLLASGDMAARLAPYRDKLMVLLQYDGETAAANRALRDADPSSARQLVLARLREHRIPMQLTMTLTHGVNEEQVGDVVRRGLENENVKVIALQPVTYSGRYDLAPDPMMRLTLSDMVRAVVNQIDPRIDASAFAPIPCSHPNCGWITLFVRRFGFVANIMKHIDLPAIMDQVAYKTLLSSGELRAAVSQSKKPSLLARIAKRLIRSSDVFTIAIKPFMDRFNYDQDRVSNCCHHLLDTEGRPVSFCEYNALVRPRDSWAAFPQIGRRDSA
jgi:tetraether lipid synthase